MGEAFKDAILTLEVTRNKDGKWWCYAHFHSEKHFNMDIEDLKLMKELQDKLNIIGVGISRHLIVEHPDKSLMKNEEEWDTSHSRVYDKETGKSITFNKEGEAVAGNLSDEDMQKRMTPEAWEDYKRWRDDRRTD